MATFIDSSILVTTSPGKVFLTLTSGYGQPVVSTVYLKKADGSSSKIKEFEGNTTDLALGQSSILKYNRIEIHSTIHDIRDFFPGQEVEDIDLYVKVTCNEIHVEMDFRKKTKGIGQLINCIYEVTIL